MRRRETETNYGPFLETIASQWRRCAESAKFDHSRAHFSKLFRTVKERLENIQEEAKEKRAREKERLARMEEAQESRGEDEGAGKGEGAKEVNGKRPRTDRAPPLQVSQHTHWILTGTEMQKKREAPPGSTGTETPIPY